MVEILVVMAILALLMNVVLPALKRAREQAKGIKCAATQYGFGTGLATYFAEEDEWIPGRNTTGYEVWKASWEVVQGNDLDALNDPQMPVQTYDWMTPIFRTTMELSGPRARRFRFLLEQYKCPSVNFTAVLYSGSRPDDEQDFIDDINTNGPFPGISYLMPGHFQFWGEQDAVEREFVGTTVYNSIEIGLPIKTPGNFFDVEVRRYRSRVNKIGAPSEKVAVADGTRYLPGSKILDFDHHEDPERGVHLQELGWYGSFTSSGAWWRGSTAYGTKQGHSPSGGANIKYTYRHHDAIQALFFDGHVESMSQKKSREIGYWYPRGARIKRCYFQWCRTDHAVGDEIR